MKYTNLIAGLLLAFVLLTTLASANVATTTMTWFVASVKTLSVSYGAPCTSSAFFFLETNAQFDPDSDGNGARVVPQGTRIAGDTNCQSSSQAAVTVANSGTATINVDVNFTTAMSGADINLELKLWQGSAGCGTNGLGGWEEPCSVTSTTSAPGTSTCREFSSGNTATAATAGQRAVTSLAVFGTQQLCFSGDFNSFVSAGDHNKTFQYGSEFS